MTLVTFLILLPCATSLMGSVFALLDRPDLPAALRRMAWRGLPFLAAGVLLGDRAAWPAVAALATASGLHLAVVGGMRLAMGRGWTIAEGKKGPRRRGIGEGGGVRRRGTRKPVQNLPPGFREKV